MRSEPDKLTAKAGQTGSKPDGTDKIDHQIAGVANRATADLLGANTAKDREAVATLRRLSESRRGFIMSGPWVDFGRVAHDRCGMQAQHCSRYIDGPHDYPALGDGLRFRKRLPDADGNFAVDTADYHNIVVHHNDADTFAARVNEYRRATGQIV